MIEKDKSQLMYENLVYYRICEELYNQMKKTNYSTFKNMCNNLRDTIMNDVYVGEAGKIMSNVMLELSVLYGMEAADTAEFLLEFLRDKKWEQYYEIVLTFKNRTPNSFN